MPEPGSIDGAEVADSSASPAVRPIHYLGNKLRVLKAIAGALDSVAGADEKVCDLFSGSGVVGGSLIYSRPVVAADIQEYSRVLAGALMRPADLTGALDDIIRRATTTLAELRASALGGLLDVEADAARMAAAGDGAMFCDIVDRGSIRACERLEHPSELSSELRLAAKDPLLRDARITTYYGGVYFSYSQAAEIDALAASVQQLDAGARDVGLAALISSASEIVATVGSHFAQPARMRTASGAIKFAAVRNALRRRSVSVLDVFTRWVKAYSSLPAPPYAGVSIRGDYRDVLRDLPSDVAAVYADPPYTRDHYSRFYHVLESLARGDDPGLSTVTAATGHVPSRGLYRRDRHQSPFCIATQVEGAFEALFRGTAERAVPLVLSYSPLSEGTAARPKTRLMEVDRLRDMAGAHFAEVTVQTAGRVAHSKLNASRLNAAVAYDAELLLVCRP